MIFDRMDDAIHRIGGVDAVLAHALPQPLPADLLPVPSFPVDALPDAFKGYVIDSAELMQCPCDFVALSLLVAAGSLVARRVAIKPQRRTDWTVRGNLWGLGVARPGGMKSPSLTLGLAPLQRLEAQAAEEFDKDMSAHVAQVMVAKLQGEARVKTARAKLKEDSTANVASLLAADAQDAAPTRRRYVVNDATYEKLGEVLEANPEGVLVARDETRGLLQHLAREEQAQARAFYLSGWSGGSYTFDRIGRGTLTVPDLRLSIIGGIQPGPLSEFMQRARKGAGDDGMLERFLVAWPDMSGDWRDVDRYPDGAAKRAAWGAFTRLDHLCGEELLPEHELDVDGLAHGLPFLRFADDAAEAFLEWRGDLEREVRGDGVSGNIEGALAKFRHHVPALALGLHVVDGGVGPVTLAATKRALALGEYFQAHAARLHSSGAGVIVKAARAILAKLKVGAIEPTFTARSVYRKQWAGLADSDVVNDACGLLVDHRHLTEAVLETGGKPVVTFTITEGARHG